LWDRVELQRVATRPATARLHLHLAFLQQVVAVVDRRWFLLLRVATEGRAVALAVSRSVRAAPGRRAKETMVEARASVGLARQHPVVVASVPLVGLYQRRRASLLAQVVVDLTPPGFLLALLLAAGLAVGAAVAATL
jgi:cytosine/adenosine deaminase-related metal-dependent hydrolase